MKRRSKTGGRPIQGLRPKTPKPTRRNASKVEIRTKPSPVAEGTEVAGLVRERDEALEQQTAAYEVLRVISSSPGDLQPVFATMLEKAARICDASFGNVHRWDGETLQLVASHNAPPAFALVRQGIPYRPDPELYIARALTTKTVIQIADAALDEAYIEKRNPLFVAAVELGGVRTALLVPILKENEPIGLFSLYRKQVRPFTDKQIELVKSGVYTEVCRR
jgi:two-component system, NtrC family, sensor kinase